MIQFEVTKNKEGGCLGSFRPSAAFIHTSEEAMGVEGIPFCLVFALNIVEQRIQLPSKMTCNIPSTRHQQKCTPDSVGRLHWQGQMTCSAPGLGTYCSCNNESSDVHQIVEHHDLMHWARSTMRKMGK